MIYNHSLYIVGLSWYLFPFCSKCRLFANQCKCSGWEAGNKLSRFGNWPIVLAPCWQQGSDRTLRCLKLSSKGTLEVCIISCLGCNSSYSFGLHIRQTFLNKGVVFFLNHAQHEMVKALKWWIEIFKPKSGQSSFVVVRCGSILLQFDFNLVYIFIHLWYNLSVCVHLSFFSGILG